METPRTSYLDHDGVKIAWQVFGDGPAEMLFVPGWVSNVDLFWQYPQPREFFTELAAFARVAVYDKPGTGASDPVDVAPPVEERIEQLVHVMDAPGLSRTTVIGVSEGGVTACLAAAARPDRVERLVMLDATAGLFDPRAKGEMSDAEHKAWQAFIRRTAETWGEGRDGDIWLAGTPGADAAWGRLQRACASPAVARRYYQSWADGLTAWDALPAIHQPTLVLQRTDDRVLPIKAARVAAQQIPRCQDGRAARRRAPAPWLGDTAEMLAQLRGFVGAPAPAARTDRVLAAILFTDLVESTDQLAKLGDAVWTARLERRATSSTGASSASMAAWSSPPATAPSRFSPVPRARRRPLAGVLEALPAEDLHARAGVHVGEIELQGDDIAGLAVHVSGPHHGRGRGGRGPRVAHGARPDCRLRPAIQGPRHT